MCMVWLLVIKETGENLLVSHQLKYCRKERLRFTVAKFIGQLRYYCT